MHYRLFLVALAALTAPVFAADLPDGPKLLAQIDAIRFPETFVMQVTMTTSSPGESDKVMALTNTHKKGFGSFLEIQAPARSKGTKMLTQEGTLWMYNPKSGSTKPLRLAPRDSFQGSSFSNSDVSKTSFTEEYAGTTEGEDTVETAEFGTVKAWRLRADATTPEAAYAKIVLWVRLAGRLRATNMTMTSLDKKGTKTVLHIDTMDEKAVSESLFNLTNLTK
jgi:hypothetical protein